MEHTVARINLYREWADALRLRAQEKQDSGQPASLAFVTLADMVDRTADDLERLLTQRVLGGGARESGTPSDG